MNKIKYDEALNYLKQSRTRADFAREFNLSVIEAWNYLKGMIKRHDVEMIRVLTGNKGRSFVYKQLRGANYEEENKYIDAYQGINTDAYSGCATSDVVLV